MTGGRAGGRAGARLWTSESLCRNRKRWSPASVNRACPQGPPCHFCISSPRTLEEGPLLCRWSRDASTWPGRNKQSAEHRAHLPVLQRKMQVSWNVNTCSILNIQAYARRYYPMAPSGSVSELTCSGGHQTWRQQLWASTAKSSLRWIYFLWSNNCFIANLFHNKKKKIYC